MPTKVATWNLEHLNDTNNERCVPRVDEDYKATREQIEKRGFYIVAFQEVENKGRRERALHSGVEFRLYTWRHKQCRFIFRQTL